MVAKSNGRKPAGDEGVQKKDRGMPTVLPKWWLIEVRRHAEGISTAQLATELSALAPRRTPWSRETVGKFLKNKWPTMELMLAFCERFEVPPPVFVARSIAEAHHLVKECRKYDPSDDKATPEKLARIRILDQALEQLEEAMADQTDTVDSSDEGIGARRRPRGMVRGRKTAS